MTTLELNEPRAARSHTHAPATPITGEAARPFGWAGTVIGGVLGTISGLAEFNALFTGNGQWATAAVFTVAGMMIGVAIGGGIGILIDLTVGSRR